MAAIPTLPQFVPQFGLRNPHLQTLAGKVLRRGMEWAMEERRLELPDGDFLDVLLSPSLGDPKRPVVLVLHGLEGSAKRGYMKTMYRALEEAGLAPVGLSFRGCSGSPNRLPRAYHSGEVEDPTFVLEWLRTTYPKRPRGLVGFSLGGNIALKLAAHLSPASKAENAPDSGGSSLKALVHACAAMSVPFDLGAGAKHLEQPGIYAFYQRYFISSLRKKVHAKGGLLEGLIDVKAGLAATTLTAFDDAVTAPLHGFASAADYYDRCSSASAISSIRTPTLIVQSKDDPFLPFSCVPKPSIQGNPYVGLVLTENGGHVGFVQSPRREHRFWGEQQIADFLRRQLFTPTRSDVSPHHY